MYIKSVEFKMMQRGQLSDYDIWRFGHRIVDARNNTRGLMLAEYAPCEWIFTHPPNKACRLPSSEYIESSAITDRSGELCYAIGVFGVGYNNLIPSIGLYVPGVMCGYFDCPNIMSNMDRFRWRALIHWDNPPYEAMEIMFPSIGKRKLTFQKMGLVGEELPLTQKAWLKRFMNDGMYGKTLADAMKEEFKCLTKLQYDRIVGTDR